MKKPRLHRQAKVNERRQPGSRADRREKPPLGVRVRYAFAILIALVASWAATQAITTANQNHELIQKIGGLALRVQTDEKATCLIQKHGLPVGHELVQVISGLHRILTLPPTPDQRQRQARIPKALLKKELRIVADLNMHLASYVRLERRVPHTRSDC